MRPEGAYNNQKYLKIGGIWFFSGQKPPISGLTIIEKSWNYGNLPYLMANTYGLNFIKIGIFEFSGGQKPIFELGWAIPAKSHVKICFGLVAPFKSYHLNFLGGRNPLLGELHVSCNAHFRTWRSYSNQKSCVKIWFGLVEPFKSYRVHKHFSGGGEKLPIWGGCIWPVMPIFELGWAIPVKSHVLKFGFDWLSLSRVIMVT